MPPERSILVLLHDAENRIEQHDRQDRGRIDPFVEKTRLYGGADEHSDDNVQDAGCGGTPRWGYQSPPEFKTSWTWLSRLSMESWKGRF